MKIVRVVMWGLVAVFNLINMIVHIRETKKAGARWFDNETCAWLVGMLSSVNCSFLNLMLE